MVQTTQAPPRIPGMARAGAVDFQAALDRFLAEILEGPDAQASSGFRLEKLTEGHSAYLCRDQNSRSRGICKFFAARPLLPVDEARHLMEYEFLCLNRTRSSGLSEAPFSVVRPLGVRADLGCLLVEEFVSGENLDHFIGRAAHDGESKALLEKLDVLAAFLARLHAISACSIPPRLSRTCNQFRTMIRGFYAGGILPEIGLRELLRLCDKWEAHPTMWDAYSCLVHGDTTPTNFIFQSRGIVTAIDLERMHVGDPVYDLGLLVAELKHHFGLRVHCSEAAEPFISHFLHCYSRYSSLAGGHFDWLAFRSRFYMALGELRIARNPWLPLGHRSWLISEAGRCLKD